MLRIRYRMRQRNLPSAEGPGSGPLGRINKMRKLVTALVRHERIEGKHPWLDESRGYAERLIQEAIKHGDKHQATMQMADYWLMEKDLVHKLFKVLVPRYQKSGSYTKMWNLPTEYPGPGYKMAVLELKDNPWPPVVPKTRDLSNSLINILVQEAKRDYHTEKISERARSETQSAVDTQSTVETNSVPKPDQLKDLNSVNETLNNLSISSDPNKNNKHVS